MKRLALSHTRRTSLWRDSNAASTIEFAIIMPVFLMFLFGVLQAGVLLQNYNAVKSISYDAGRLIMVEYQKNNELSDDQIRGLVLARAVNAPYYLETDRLTINIDSTGTSRVSGATEVDVEIQYTPESFVPGLEVPFSTVTYSRPVFVVS